MYQNYILLVTGCSNIKTHIYTNNFYIKDAIGYNKLPDFVQKEEIQNVNVNLYTYYMS